MKDSSKKFNLPAYINIPFFLYQDDRLDKSTLLLASFFYSLFTAGKNIKASNEYLSQLLRIEIRNVQSSLLLLEEKLYIKRVGLGCNRHIKWLFMPESEIIVVDEGLNNHDASITPTMMPASPQPRCQHHPYIKEDIKDTTTSSSSNFLENYKEKEEENLYRVNEEFTKQQMVEKFRRESLNDELSQSIFKERFKGINITLEQLYEECVDYWSQTDQQVYKARFVSHLKKTPLSKYQESNKSTQSKGIETEAERMARYAKERASLKQKLNSK